MLLTNRIFIKVITVVLDCTKIFIKFRDLYVLLINFGDQDPKLEKTTSTASLGGPAKSKELIEELKDKTEDTKPEDKKPATERTTSSRFANNAFIRQDSVKVDNTSAKETSHSRENSSTKETTKPKEDEKKSSSSPTTSTTKSPSSSSSDKDLAPKDSVEYSTKQYWEIRYKQYVPIQLIFFCFILLAIRSIY